MRDSSRAKQTAETLKRLSRAELGPVHDVPLDQIQRRPEAYRHRPDSELDEKNAAMKALADNLVVEGLKEPLVVQSEPDGRLVLICGHRRVAALEQLADSNTDGFARTMDVPVREIVAGDRHDALVLSVADNVVREPVDELHRSRAAITLLEAGVAHARIRAALRLSDSTFDRMRRLAAYRWMLGHVERDEVGLTVAHELLAAAAGKGGQEALDHLREDLAREVGGVRGRIAARAELLAQQNKELGRGEAQVKSQIPRHLIGAWTAALKRGDRIPARATYHYAAGIVADKAGRRLVVPAISGLCIVESELERLAEIFVRLDRLVKDLRPHLNALARQRQALRRETAEHEPAAPLDFVEAGLEAVAEVLGAIPSAVAEADPTPPANGAGEATSWEREDRRQRRTRRTRPAPQIAVTEEQPGDDAGVGAGPGSDGEDAG
jgi:hypothetical protein